MPASKSAVEASRASAEAAQQEAAQLRQLVGGLAVAGVNQAREFAAIRAAISKPAHVVNLAKFTEKPEPVKPWAPPAPKADPLTNAPWWKKIYIKAFEPAQLRRRVG